ncbi:hypothetical protein [Ectobacillus panaciterrae]|uniref:hypothetical protein n=1 Tax=Ectobacillus panaciterrae TaxID=363872 RepID=UPI000406B601|nr:hypothetical protein [Ectobacillus panaciterrae]
MNKKVEILKIAMITLTLLAVFVTILPNALDLNETLAGKISIFVMGTAGACLVNFIIYVIVKKAILRGEK